MFVRDDQVLIILEDVAKSLACRTGPDRVVEGKEERGGFLKADIASMTFKPGVEPQDPFPDNLYKDTPSAFLKGHLNRVSDPPPHRGGDGNPVDYNLYLACREAVFNICGEFTGDCKDLISGPDPEEPLLDEVG